jgi:hypothetical protein
MRGCSQDQNHTHTYSYNLLNTEPRVCRVRENPGPQVDEAQVKNFKNSYRAHILCVLNMPFELWIVGNLRVLALRHFKLFVIVYLEHAEKPEG